MWGKLASFGMFATLAAQPAYGQNCPEITVQVDNDIRGSGYSEQPEANWLSRPTGACHGTYRYLSHTVGDGSRRGRAIWQPAITVDGWYRVVTSYRATENRTDNADYVLHDDIGGTTRREVSQQHAGDCTRADLGLLYCRAGGTCRLVLDGTDDGASDSADITTFTLERCADAPPPVDPPPSQRCGAIASAPGFEMCGETTTGCEGVFTNGAGCVAFCAAANMECVGRWGGEPGCNKEAQNRLACDANNGHQSDWCECAPTLGPDPDPPPVVRPPTGDGLERVGEALTWCGAPTRLVGYGNYGIVAESAFDYEVFFDGLRRRGVNFVRVWGQYQWANDLMPFDGTRGDWDLTAANAAFYARLPALVDAAAARGVVVMVTLFDSVGLEGASDSGNRWINSPYRRANNRQSYLRDPTEFNLVSPNDTPPVWRDVNQPYIERMIDTLCDRPNVIYEVMNEPEGSGGDAGRGTPAFVEAALGEIHRLLARDRCTGSRVIATNDNTLRTLGDPRVDVVAVHVAPDEARRFENLGKPIIISNDGDDSQVSNANGFGTLGEADRASRIAAYTASTFAARNVGMMHLEILDKDMHGPSWTGQDYAPRADRVTGSILDVLNTVGATPLEPCAVPPPAIPAPDAGSMPPRLAADAGVIASAPDAMTAGPPAFAEAEQAEGTCGCATTRDAGTPLGLLLLTAMFVVRRRQK